VGIRPAGSVATPLPRQVQLEGGSGKLGSSFRRVRPMYDVRLGGGMSVPVSRPVLIALIGAVLFVGIFTLHRRGGSSETASAPSSQTTPSPQSSQPASPSQQATQPSKSTRTNRSPVRAPAPAASSRSVSHKTALPRPVRRALDANKVVVLLLWNPKGTDDKAVKSAVDSLPRRGGDVRVFSDTSRHAARYVRITSATDVSQTPTLVVVNRRGKARVATGYLDGQSVEQYVVDAFRGR
jgi:hypothetical protein